METDFSQTCAHCGKQFILAPHARHRAKKRNQKNFYCKRRCFHLSQRKGKIKTYTCLHCGAETKNKRHCTRCIMASGGVAHKYTPDEILHLASINPGYGFREFINKLYNSGGTNNYKVMALLQEYKESTGIDLYALLQSPDYMVKMHWSDYLEKYGELPNDRLYLLKQERPPKEKRGLGGKRYSTIMGHPDFNWGDVEQRDPY